MRDKNLIREEIRKHENDFQKVFCTSVHFSDKFMKNEDDLITLMWDHHQFIAETQDICESDIQEAVQYQKEHGCNFLKIDSRFPLSKHLIETFKLDESVTITMVNLHSKDSLAAHFRVNPAVVIKDVQVDQIEQDLLAIDLKNHRDDCGEEFVRQFVSAFSLKSREDKRLHYLGAYLNDKICGYCYYFDDGNYKVLDGLTVNEESRHQYVASSLISYIIAASDSVMYLHADRDDTPKEMYRKMGFEDIDLLYEYVCTEL